MTRLSGSKIAKLQVPGYETLPLGMGPAIVDRLVIPSDKEVRDTCIDIGQVAATHLVVAQVDESLPASSAFADLGYRRKDTAAVEPPNLGVTPDQEQRKLAARQSALERYRTHYGQKTPDRVTAPPTASAALEIACLFERERKTKYDREGGDNDARAQARIDLQLRDRGVMPTYRNTHEIK